MDDDTLEAYVRHYIAASEPQNEVAFTWQGGEPTLLGLDFYRRAVRCQAKSGAGRKISNSLRLTACCSMINGVHLATGFYFFVIHWTVRLILQMDIRVTKWGRPTHKLVMRALTLLQKHHVDYNVLVCVNRTSAQQPFRYDFCAMRESNSSSLFRSSHSAWLMKQLPAMD